MKLSEFVEEIRKLNLPDDTEVCVYVYDSKYGDWELETVEGIRYNNISKKLYLEY